MAMSLKFECRGRSVGTPRGHKHWGWQEFTCPSNCPEAKNGRRCTTHWGAMAGTQTRSKK